MRVKGINDGSSGLLVGDMSVAPLQVPAQLSQDKNGGGDSVDAPKPQLHGSRRDWREAYQEPDEAPAGNQKRKQHEVADYLPIRWLHVGDSSSKASGTIWSACRLLAEVAGAVLVDFQVIDVETTFTQNQHDIIAG